MPPKLLFHYWPIFEGGDKEVAIAHYDPLPKTGEIGMSLNQLKPANTNEVAVYAPYYADKRRKYLGHAISLYKEKHLEGSRHVEGGQDIPFVATWNVSMLPSDLTRCRMQFDDNPELSYEVMLPTSEFVDYLIDLLLNYHRTHGIDFSKGFYRKLLRYD